VGGSGRRRETARTRAEVGELASSEDSKSGSDEYEGVFGV